jgi:hypothetical protein
VGIIWHPHDDGFSLVTPAQMQQMLGRLIDASVSLVSSMDEHCVYIQIPRETCQALRRCFFFHAVLFRKYHFFVVDVRVTLI